MMNFDADLSGDPQPQAFDQDQDFLKDLVFARDQSFVNVQNARKSPIPPNFWAPGGPDQQALPKFSIRTSPGQHEAAATVAPRGLLLAHQNQAQHYQNYMPGHLPQNQAQIPQTRVGPFQNQAQLPINQYEGPLYHAHDPALEPSAWPSPNALQQMHPHSVNSDSVNYSHNGDLDRSVAGDSVPDGNEEPNASEGTGQNTHTTPEDVGVDPARGTPSSTHRCELCPKSYETQKQLERHKKDTHGPQAYRCPFRGCPQSVPGRGFTRAWSRTRHVDKCDFNPKSFSETTSLTSQAVLSPATVATEVENEQGKGHDTGSSQWFSKHDKAARKRLEKNSRKHVRKARKLLERRLKGKDLRKLQTSFEKAFECMKQVAAASREKVAEQVLDIVVRGGKGEHEVEEEEEDDDGEGEDDDDDDNGGGNSGDLN